jgi:hypothetical protein
MTTTANATPSRLLTEREAASLLGISIKTLQNARYKAPVCKKTGEPRHSPLAEIPVVRFGSGPRKTVRFEEAAIARFIEAHRTTVGQGQ